MNRNILIMTNEHPRFYLLLGPFLANRVVAKAYGDKMWDDAGMTWVVAIAPDDQVMGFAAITPHGRGVQLCNDYVRPEYRNEQNTVQSELIDMLLKQCPSSTLVTVVASQAEREFYEAKGFIALRHKGSFIVMTKTIGEDHHA